MVQYASIRHGGVQVILVGDFLQGMPTGSRGFADACPAIATCHCCLPCCGRRWRHYFAVLCNAQPRLDLRATLPPLALQLPPVDKGPEDCRRAAQLAVQNLEEKLIK